MNVNAVSTYSNNRESNIMNYREQISSYLSTQNNDNDSFKKLNAQKQNVSFGGLRTFILELFETKAETEARILSKNFARLKSQAHALGLPSDGFSFSKAGLQELENLIKFEDLKIEAKRYGAEVKKDDTYNTLYDRIQSHKPCYSSSADEGGYEGYTPPDGRSVFAPYDM